MTIRLAEIVASSFRTIADKYGFRQQNEVNNGSTYSVEYASKDFVVRLEQYRTELYATLYKTGNPDKQIDLFNLLAFMAHPQMAAPASEYFYDEANVEERFRKQVDYVTTVLDKDFAKICDFLKADDYASKVARVDDFMLKKYPELFKKCSTHK